MKKFLVLLCGALSLFAEETAQQEAPTATDMAQATPAPAAPAAPTAPATPAADMPKPAPKPPAAVPADGMVKDTPKPAAAPTGDNSPVQYNVDLPTGDQRQPIYFTKDMTFNIGTAQIGFYGFIKFDYLAQTRIAGSVGSGATADVILNNVPLDSDSADKHMESLLDARSSRLGIKIEDNYKGIAMKGAVETDFSTPDGSAIQSNSRVLRIRLAYATAELPSHFFFLVGQYYALPMHYPEIDMPTRVNVLHYPAGVIDARQPQARVGYKQYFSDTSLLQYEANAELQGYNTTGTVTAKGGDTAQAAEQKWPLFNAKAAWLSKMFKIEAAFSGTQAYAITNAAGNRVHTPVWGVTGSGSFTWEDLILWGTIHHFVGLTGLSSNYLSQMTLIDSNTRLKAAKANGGSIALRYDFIKKALWTDIMYGFEYCYEIPGTTLFSGSALKRIDDFRANLVGAFWKHWQIGAEYERTYVEAFNGVSGYDNMYHLGVWYVFGQP